MKIIFLVVLYYLNPVQSQPDLPNHFSGSGTVSVSGTDLTGEVYFDYALQAFRFDSDFTNYSEITLFNIEDPTRFIFSNGYCLPVTLPMGSQLFTAEIPQFALFGGYSNINNKPCQQWTFKLFDTTADFYVTNYTTHDNKTMWEHVKVTLSAPFLSGDLVVAFDIQANFPPDPAKFDVSPWNCPPPTPLSSFSFGGFAIDGFTNGLIPGCEVFLQGTEGNFSGNTNDLGYYEFSGVSTGTYNLIVRSPKYYYFFNSVYINSTVQPGGKGDAILVPIVDSDQWRATLSWNSEPHDLDFHVRTPKGCVVGYTQRSCVDADLNLDITQGWGPETLTFSGGQGNYTIFVYLFDGAGSYKTSNARIRLYNSASTDPIIDLYVPTESYDAQNRFWYVLDFDPHTGSITVVNSVVPSL